MPQFKENEIFVKDDGRRYLVLAVGEEAYFVKRLDVWGDIATFRESAWGFEGAEADVVRRVSQSESWVPELDELDLRQIGQLADEALAEARQALNDKFNRPLSTVAGSEGS